MSDDKVVIHDIEYGIRDVFARLTPHLVADKKLWKKLREVNNRFVTKNDDHISFFGSTLLGCYIIKYVTNDERKKWFDEVIGVPEATIKAALMNPQQINPKHQVSSDILSLSCVYVAYLCMNSNQLNDKQKHESAGNALKQIYYRYIGSKLSRYFKYPCSYDSALTTYNSLSKKYDIKNYGSWGKLIEDKVNQLLNPRSVFYKGITTMRENDSVMYVARAISTKVVAMLGGIYDRHKQMSGDSKNRVLSSNDTVIIDGDVVQREKTNNLVTYNNYINNIINTKSFIKTELVDIVLEVMGKARRDYFMSALNYLYLNYGKPKYKHLTRFVELDLVYAFEVMKHNNFTYGTTTDVVIKLRAKFTAPKGSDPELLELRKTGEDIITDATQAIKFTSYSPAAERTALMLYIILRAISMKYYS